MLPPDSRAILRDLLKPPIGSLLRQAVGTTFTVDLSAALSVPLSFAARDLGDTPDSIGVMEAVRSSAERVDIFYQAGPTRHDKALRSGRAHQSSDVASGAYVSLVQARCSAGGARAA